MGFRLTRVIVHKAWKTKPNYSLSAILMENYELRPPALRVLVLAPFHITDERTTKAREDEQPPPFKLRKEEER